MICAYIRVSTDKQNTLNQKFEIERHLQRKNMRADKWLEETASGAKKASDRKLGGLLKKMKRGDVLIVSEISRLGRDLLHIMDILYVSMQRGIKIVAIKENYELGDNLNSKVLAFAFGLSAEIERKLISARTKEALAKRRADGVVLGRPKGRDFNILNAKRDFVLALIKKNVPKAEITRRLGIKRSSLYNFINKNKNLRA